MTELFNKPAPSKNNSSKPTSNWNDNNRPTFKKNNNNSEFDRFSSYIIENAKKLKQSKVSKLSKSKKSKKLAKSKNPSKNRNFLDFGAKKFKLSFLTSGIKTAFNYLWLAFIQNFNFLIF